MMRTWTSRARRSPAAAPRHLGVDDLGRDVLSRPGRLRLLADSYGLQDQDRQCLMAEVAAMQVRQAAQVADDALTGDPASARLWKYGHFTGATGRSLLWLGRHRDRFDLAIFATAPV
jgi:hypothetical protein